MSTKLSRDRFARATVRARQRIERSLSIRLVRATINIDFASAAADAKRAGASDPAGIGTHMTRRELAMLYGVARGVVPAARALEIGSYLGASSVFLAAGLQAGGGSLVCVDTWENDAMDERRRDTHADFQRNVGALANVVSVRKRSQELLSTDVAPPLTLVFLDADHSYEAVKGDFGRVAPWLVPGGLLLLHDAVHFQGVSRTIGEVLAGGGWQLDGYVDNLVALRKSAPTR